MQEIRTGSIYVAASQTTGVYLMPRLIGALAFNSSNLQRSQCLFLCIYSSEEWCKKAAAAGSRSLHMFAHVGRAT